MTMTLVTGSNRGIGLEICRLLAQRGDHVIAVCREPSDELLRTGSRIEAGIDVSEPSSLARMTANLTGVSLDVLINNAGILSRQNLGDIDADEIEKIKCQFEVNSLGPLLVTQALLENLHRGSKVAIVSSRMGSLADNTSGGSYGYRMSKAAVNMAGVSLARDLKDRGIAVGLLHPGWVRTDMTGGTGQVEAREAAAGLIARIDDLSLQTTGSFRHANSEPLPW